MADSDAEELSVGSPSPVPGNRGKHAGYNVMNSDEDRSSSFSTPPPRSKNDLVDVTSDNSNGTSQKVATCALCKNHRIASALRGHKRYCPFRECPCDLCNGTRRRQKINAQQVATRRARALDEERKKKGLPVPVNQQPTGSPPPLHRSTSPASSWNPSIVSGIVSGGTEYKSKARSSLAMDKVRRDPYPTAPPPPPPPPPPFIPTISNSSGDQVARIQVDGSDRSVFGLQSYFHHLNLDPSRYFPLYTHEHIQRDFPIIHRNPFPLDLQSHVRDSVIKGPYPSIHPHPSMYHNHPY